MRIGWKTFACPHCGDVLECFCEVPFNAYHPEDFRCDCGGVLEPVDEESAGFNAQIAAVTFAMHEA
jgi:hypothetical protein